MTLTGRHLLLLSFLAIATDVCAQVRADASASQALPLQRALYDDFGLELWTVLPSEENDIWVATKPTYLTSGLCRTFVLRGKKTDRVVFNDPELMEQAKHFYFFYGREESRRDSGADCASISFDRYFAVPRPIEEGTLAELAAFLASPSTANSISQECACQRVELQEIRVDSFGALIDIHYLASYKTSTYAVVVEVWRSEGAYLLGEPAKVHD